MPLQKAWDIYEAAILLEALVMVKEEKLSRKDAIESVSKKLRQKAYNEGTDIDDIFRNVAGITFQMHSMESAYVGHIVFKPATKLFSKIAGLLKEDKEAFKKILEEAHKMIATKNNFDEQFLSWLSDRVSSAQLSELYMTFELIEKFCLKRKIIKEPLLEIKDLNQLANVRDTINQNHICKFKNKRQINKMSTAIKYFIDFVKEYESKINIVDEEVIEKAVEEIGTEDGSIKSVEYNPEDRKDDFVEWMRNQGMTKKTATAYAFSCGLSGKFAIEHGIASIDVWKINNVNVLKDMFNALLENQEFLDKNESRHSQFRASFVKYIQFCGDENFKTECSAVKSDKIYENITEEDELIKKQYPELYIRLNSMSKVYNNPAGVSVEEIRMISGLSIESEILKDILNRISWITEVSEGMYSFSKSVKSYEKQIEFDKDLFVLVLMQRCRNGMRFDSIDLEKFRDAFFDITEEKIQLSDSDLETCLRKCGIVYQGRLFPSEGIIDSTTKEKLLFYIRDSFEQGKKVLYFKAIFSDLADTFSYCFNLTDALMLKPYLEYITEPGEYYFTKEYISCEKNVKVDHTSELEGFLISEGRPLSYDEIYAGLFHISKDVIYSEIKSNPKIIMNEKEHYYHYDIFEFSSEDADCITKYIQDEIDEEGYCIWSRIYKRIQKEMPIFIENNTYLSSIGIRNAVAKKLAGRFTFDGKVIGSNVKALNMSTVYQLYGEHHAPFSDNDIYEFSKEVNGGVIYFDSLAEKTVRVSRELFIAKDQISFDILAIDNALSTYLATGYMLIKDVDSFLIFPNVGYEWNLFLIESYLMYYSKNYAIRNNGKSLNNVAGALVKRNSGFNEFEDVCADVLANAYVELTKNKALDYLADLNLLTRRSYAGIDKAIAKAKQIRSRKG